MLSNLYFPSGARLSNSHVRRLMWFAAQAGSVTGWPKPLDDGLRLVCAPKGIYKPEDLEYALSVRFNTGSSYMDGRIARRDDGSWFFAYHQEGLDPAGRDIEYTNRGLMACIRDGVPVGVMLQEPSVGRSSRYKVMGLARAVEWENGYFFFESLDGPREPRGDTVAQVILSETEFDFERQTSEEVQLGDYDARRRVYRQIVERRGQPAFRRSLMQAYDKSCAMTGCAVEPVLEAAHLFPYRGPDSNSVTNGLLLRADVHTMMDLGLVAVHPHTRLIAVADQLSGSEYEALDGRRLVEPVEPSQRPAVSGLSAVWDRFQRRSRV